MNKIKSILIALTLTLSLGFAATTQAQSKVAHINAQEFIENLPSYNNAMSQLQKLEQSYRSDIDATLKEAQKKNQQYQSEAETVTREENEKRAMELQEMEQSIREYQQTASQEIQKKREELLRPVLEKAREVIQQVAREKGYEYVFDSSTGAGVLMADGYDLMDDAKAAIGE
ncbi:OmpH family outer membrane protein [Psychroflexus halocasei]|uniref:Outer membrane protein n=1 Tax=Psychroflexus halocasei TaxID=908615 RepID=A0A1H3VP94_9FLAO|nr:OmpH family outer membrane protein [Psychroflexus halocasei]SDZ76569.1 outer membrane protein [Psychroflexus halocasei]